MTNLANNKEFIKFFENNKSSFYNDVNGFNFNLYLDYVDVNDVKYN